MSLDSNYVRSMNSECFLPGKGYFHHCKVQTVIVSTSENKTRSVQPCSDVNPRNEEVLFLAGVKSLNSDYDYVFVVEKMFDMNASMLLYVKTEIKKPEINASSIIVGKMFYLFVYVKIFNHLIGDIS